MKNGAKNSRVNVASLRAINLLLKSLGRVKKKKKNCENRCTHKCDESTNEITIQIS